jgi:predicted ABC-class ATPase
VPRKPVLHEQDYIVANGPVRLSVIVGERQFGSSMVFIDDDQVANGIVEELVLGDGDKLEGSKCVIYTLVTDIRDNTDEMSVTWIIAGGSHRVTATATGSPAKKFGSQMFKAIFRFQGQ